MRTKLRAAYIAAGAAVLVIAETVAAHAVRF